MRLLLVVGDDGMTPVDRSYLAFGRAFERELLHQAAARTLEASMETGWRLLAGLPEGELTRLSDAQIAAHLRGRP